MKYLVILVLCILPLNAFAQSGWYPIHPPIGRTDLDVATDSMFGFFGNGTTCITYDAGKTWVQKSAIPAIPPGPGDHGYRSIKVLAPNTIILYGDADDGYNHPQTSNTHSFTETSADSGSTWTGVQLYDYTNAYTHSIIGHTKARWAYGFHVYLEGYPGYSSVSDGRTNKGLAGGSLIENLEMRDDSIGMYVLAPWQTNSQVFVTTNGGSTWMKSPIALANDFAINELWAQVHPGPGHDWFVSNDSELLVSHDTGASWFHKAFFSFPITQFQFLDSVGYVVLLNQDYIEKTTDGGRTWTAQSCYNGTNSVSNIVVTSRDVAYAWDNSNSDIMRTADGKTLAEPVMSFPRIVAYGDVPHDSVVTKTISVHNYGHDTLIVSGYISDSSKVTVSPSSFRIPSGDSLPVQVHYSTHIAAWESIRVRFQTNTVPEEEIFHVTGVAFLPLLQYTPKSIDFGTVLVGERQTKKLQISNLGQDSARFVSAKTSSTLFSSGLPFDLRIFTSEVISLSFAPALPVSYDAMLIITSNELTPDTILLHGTGISSRNGNVLQDWHANYPVNDMHPGIATNILPGASGKMFVTGLIYDSAQINNYIGVSFVTTSQQTSTSTIDRSSALVPFPTCLISDNLGGYYATCASRPDILDLNVCRMDSDGSAIWRDTISGPGKGTYQYSPVVLATNNRNECALLASGFQVYNQGQYTSDQGQVLLKAYTPTGKTSYFAMINGDASYIGDNIGTVYGLDYGVDLKGFGNNFVSTLSLDHGHAQQYSFPNGYPVDYTADALMFGDSFYNFAYSEHNNFGGGLLQVADTMIYEAGRAKDSSWYVLAVDTAHTVHYRTTISKNIPLDQLYVFSVNPDTSAILMGFKTNPLSGRDLSIMKVSASGAVLWQDMFDGLGSGDDNPVKMIVKDGYEYVLVQSMDTAGNDWVLLKYDSVGNQIFRQRYVGPVAGENTARDFTLLDNGTIYVVGGACIDTGIQQFTVVKYGDTTADSVPAQPIAPPTLNAHLTNNPWSTTTTLAIDKAPNAEVTIHIYDILGNERFATTTTSNGIRLNAGDFPTGFYTAQLTDPNGARALIKFVKL
jgi:hypothetical protein